jgi:hypothetical protein
MRRVVAEQIEALAELSQIVTRNGGTLEGGRAPREERVTYREVQPVAAVSGQRQAAAPRTVAQIAPAPAAAQQPAPAPVMEAAAVVVETTETVAVAVEPAPAAPQPAAQPQQRRPAPQPTKAAQPPKAPAQPPRAAAPSQPLVSPARTPEGEQGWVSNLLRRASEDTPIAPAPAAAAPAAPTPAPARPAGNGAGDAGMSNALKTLSADIAKAIDHKAAVEVWERFRRGEKGAFTRRLYTLQGQQTFDEIRKKVQKSKEFKDAVDRYVTDFEKLLAEVTKNGADNAAGTAYLASDTGKVYTMLAHASGRFDG